MTIKVKANGLTFSFPDGTTQAEIEDVIDEHFSEPGFWSEVGAVAATSAAKLVDGIAQMLPGMNSAQYDFDIDKGVTKVRSTEIAENLPDSLKPQTTAGQVAAEIIPAIPGAFAGGRNLNPRALDATTGWLKRAAYAIPENIGASAGSQLLSKGDATAGNTAADAAAGALLSGAIPGLGRFVKALMRGQNEGQILDAAQTINEQLPHGVDFTPSRAALDGSRVSAFMETAAGATLGGGGIMQRFNAANSAALNEFANVLRRGMAGDAPLTSQELGDALRTAGTAFAQVKKEAGEVSFQAATRYAAGIRIRLLDTAREMAAIRRVGEENPGIAKLLDTDGIRAIAQSIDDSAGGLTLEGVVGLKDKISDLMDNPGLGLATTDTRKLTRLYNALNDDVTRVLGANDPAALRLWKQGNEQWTQYAERTKAVNELFGKGEGDTLYARLFGKPSDSLSIINADKVRLLLGMLPEDVAAQVRAEIVYRAGLETAAQQGAGEAAGFSAANFLTNLNKLDRNGVLDLLSGQHRADIDALATISQRLKEINRTANYSNTGNQQQVVGQMAAIGSAAAGLGMLNPFAAAAALSPVVLSNISARWMTNPELAAGLRRLADGAINDGEARRVLTRLVIAATQGDATDQEIDAVIDAIEGAESQPAK